MYKIYLHLLKTLFTLVLLINQISKAMKNIEFTSGIINHYDHLIFTLTLFKGLKQVYIAHIDCDEAIKLIGRHKTITIIN